MNKVITKWEIPTSHGMVELEVRAKGAPGEVKFFASSKPTEYMAGILREDADLNALFLSVTEAVESASVEGWEKKIYVKFKGGEIGNLEFKFGKFSPDRSKIDRSSGSEVGIEFSYGIVEVARNKNGLLVRTPGKTRSERVELFARGDEFQFTLLDYTEERFEALCRLADRFGLLTDELNRMFHPDRFEAALMSATGPLSLPAAATAVS